MTLLSVLLMLTEPLMSLVFLCDVALLALSMDPSVVGKKSQIKNFFKISHVKKSMIRIN